MAGQLSNEQGVDLERMIDQTSLETVIEALAVICIEKGQHLRVNWQDVPSARQWEAAATKLTLLSRMQTIKNVSL